MAGCCALIGGLVVLTLGLIGGGVLRMVPDDIANYQTVGPILEPKEVKIVTSHNLGRAAKGCQFQFRDLRHVLRKQRLLDFGG